MYDQCRVQTDKNKVLCSSECKQWHTPQSSSPRILNMFCYDTDCLTHGNILSCMIMCSVSFALFHCDCIYKHIKTDTQVMFTMVKLNLEVPQFFARSCQSCPMMSSDRQLCWNVNSCVLPEMLLHLNCVPIKLIHPYWLISVYDEMLQSD